ITVSGHVSGSGHFFTRPKLGVRSNDASRGMRLSSISEIVEIFIMRKPVGQLLAGILVFLGGVGTVLAIEYGANLVKGDEHTTLEYLDKIASTSQEAERRRWVRKLLRDPDWILGTTAALTPWPKDAPERIKLAALDVYEVSNYAPLIIVSLSAAKEDSNPDVRQRAERALSEICKICDAVRGSGDGKETMKAGSPGGGPDVGSSSQGGDQGSGVFDWPGAEGAVGSRP
ncbi:MAG: hypothetical protein WD042_10525, partial [Phycisphaeraceae bacterium]